MTQVFTGVGLGLQGSSLTQLGNFGPKSSANLGKAGEGVYLNAVNGNLVIQQKDLIINNAGLKLDLFETYNSQSGAWSFSLDSHLSFEGELNTVGSRVTRISEDGHVSLFVYDASQGAYLSQEGNLGRLTYDGKAWIYKEGSTFSHYDASGRLTALSDSDGHRLSLSYLDGHLVKVVDHSGKQETEWLFSQGVLTEVSFYSEGKLIQHLSYAYDDLKRLTYFSREMGEDKNYWVSYSYQGDSLLINRILQSDGSESRIEYDLTGRVVHLCDGQGRESFYDYGENQTKVSNGLGEAWIYHYDEAGHLIRLTSPLGHDTLYEYQGSHLKSMVQGSAKWSFNYNEAGDCILASMADGRLITRRFDKEHRLLAETHQSSKELSLNQDPSKRFIYDDKGHLRFELNAYGLVTEHRYDSKGLRESTRTYLDEYFSLSTLRVKEDPSLESLQAWTLTQKPYTIKLSTYFYDWRGALSEERHFNRVDIRGDGILDEDTQCLYTQFDAEGRLIQSSSVYQGRCLTNHFLYDKLGRLIKTIDSQGNVQSIDYDDSKQRLLKTDAKGTQTLEIYDHSGLLLSSQILNQGQDYGLTRYYYDKASRLISKTLPDGRAAYFFYDAEGRLEAETSPEGLATEYLYDENSHCIQKHIYAHLMEKVAIENLLSWELMKPRASSQDRFTHIIYNENQEIAYEVDALGGVIGFSYNVEHQLIRKKAYAQILKDFKAGEFLSLKELEERLDFKALTAEKANGLTNISDRELYYYYDKLGRLEAEIDAEGGVKAYHYDTLGNLIETRRYATFSTHPTGDWPLDEPEKTQEDLREVYFYNNLGLKIAYIDTDGFFTEYAYDSRGLLIKSLSYATALSEEVLTKDYDADPLSSLRPKRHSNDRLIIYKYNDVSQLIEENHGESLVIYHDYDAQGLLISTNRIDKKSAETRGVIYRYSPKGQLIQSLDERGVAKLRQLSEVTEAKIEEIWQAHSTRYAYDAAGHLISKTNASGKTAHYIYDERGWLLYSIGPEGSLREYHYNAFGQVEKSIGYASRWLDSTPPNLERVKLFLKSETHPAIDEVYTYEYNSLGQLISQEGGKGKIRQTYNVFGECETKTLNATKTSSNLYLYDKKGLLKSSLEDITGVNRRLDYDYDAFGRVIKKTSATRSERFAYDKRDNLISTQIAKPLANPEQEVKETTTSLMSYDAFSRLLQVKDKKGHLLYTYEDEKNGLKMHRTGDSLAVEICFNAYGDKLTYTDANRQKTLYSYDVAGNLSSITEPEGQTKTYSYDKEGFLLTEKASNGLVIAYEYDAVGHILIKTLDPQGLNIKTSYEYDGLGRRLKVIESGLCTEFSYDSNGNLVKKVADPQGLNSITEYEYEASGLLVKEIQRNPGGYDKVMAYEWDGLGRCTKKRLDPQGLNLSTTYAYDGDGNLLSETDAKGQKTSYLYDERGLLCFEINARGGVSEYHYGDFDKPIQRIRYANLLPSSDYADEASLKGALKRDSAHDQVEFFTYDDKGNLIEAYDALGYLTTYAYDNNDNLLSKTAYAKPYSLEALEKGEVLSPEESGRKSEYLYDGLNRLRYELKGEGRLIGYEYDEKGNVSKETHYARLFRGSLQNLSLKSLSETLHLDPDKDPSIHYAYDSLGRLSAKKSAEGVLTHYAYDGLGHLISSTQYAHYAKDLSDFKTSPQDRTQHFIYDCLGRERYRISAQGQVVERRYDILGNVVEEITHGLSLRLGRYDEKSLEEALENTKEKREKSYSYDALGRLIHSMDEKQYQTSYDYDENNNLKTKTEANGAIWTYEYDELNQLIKTISPKTTIVHYQGQGFVNVERSIITTQAFDSFGNIIQKIQDAGVLHQITEYRYDQKNQKVAIIHPQRMVNIANDASLLRQEEAKTCEEHYRYNAFGELIASSDALRNWQHFAYNEQGELIFSVDELNQATGYEYDALGNRIKKTSYEKPLLQDLLTVNEFSLDKTLRGGAKDRHEYYLYDRDNRLIESKKDAILSYNPKDLSYTRLSPCTQWEYSTFGEILTEAKLIHANSFAVQHNYYDDLGAKIASIDAEGYLTTYEYNFFGELEREVQYANPATDISLSGYKKPTASLKDRSFIYSYDALGRLTKKVQSQVSHQSLKAIGYETQVSDLLTSYSYDSLGNVIQTTDAMGHSAYRDYNLLGQVIAEIGVENVAGRSAKTYSYDALGQLAETKIWAKGAAHLGQTGFSLIEDPSRDILKQNFYDNRGQLLAEVDGNGAFVFFSYDANGRLSRRWELLSALKNTSLLVDHRYVYDAKGRLIQTLKYDGTYQWLTEEVGYNAFGEISTKGKNGVNTQFFDYDLGGNLWRSNAKGFYQIYLYDLHRFDDRSR